MRTLVGDLVVTSEMLQYFYYFMTLSLYGTAQDIPLEDRSAAAVIAIRIMNGAESPDFDIDPRGTLPSLLDRKIRDRCNDQMEFTFGHEFAHYLRGHLALSDDEYIDIKTFSHELEYEADCYAIELVENPKKQQIKLAIAGCEVLMFLHFLELLGESPGTRKFSVTNTHPSAVDRLIRLIDRVRKILPHEWQSAEQLVAQVMQLATFVTESLEYGGRPDILIFEGSVYLPGFTRKRLRDRIDF
jgi:hypothetical protein